MKPTRFFSLTGLLIGGALLLAACGSSDEEIVPTAVFEPTAAPAGQPPAATAAPAATVVAPTAAPAVPSGDAANGETLFGANGCSGCHSTGSNRVVGPGLSGVGVTAETRVADQTADEYLTKAVVSPNDFVVPDFFPGLMPPTFGQTLSEQEVSDIVAYLKTLP